uniref:DPPIV_N domain-containing protein n=1 Tax=Heterorhabditis bacteriophora TaxID=37862 RepID=A0A1I7WA01_HETBA
MVMEYSIPRTQFPYYMPSTTQYLYEQAVTPQSSYPNFSEPITPKYFNFLNPQERGYDIIEESSRTPLTTHSSRHQAKIFRPYKNMRIIMTSSSGPPDTIKNYDSKYAVRFEIMPPSPPLDPLLKEVPPIHKVFDVAIPPSQRIMKQLSGSTTSKHNVDEIAQGRFKMILVKKNKAWYVVQDHSGRCCEWALNGLCDRHWQRLIIFIRDVQSSFSLIEQIQLINNSTVCLYTIKRKLKFPVLRTLDCRQRILHIAKLLASHVFGVAPYPHNCSLPELPLITYIVINLTLVIIFIVYIIITFPAIDLNNNAIVKNSDQDINRTASRLRSMKRKPSEYRKFTFDDLFSGKVFLKDSYTTEWRKDGGLICKKDEFLGIDKSATVINPGSFEQVKFLDDSDFMGTMSSNDKYAYTTRTVKQIYRHSNEELYRIFRMFNGTTSGTAFAVGPKGDGLETILAFKWNPNPHMNDFVFVHEYNIYYQYDPEKPGTAVKITEGGDYSLRYGVADWLYEGKFKCCSRFCLLMFDDRETNRVFIPKYVKERQYAQYVEIPYPKAGVEINPTVTLYIWDRSSNKSVILFPPEELTISNKYVLYSYAEYLPLLFITLIYLGKSSTFYSFIQPAGNGRITAWHGGSYDVRDIKGYDRNNDILTFISSGGGLGTQRLYKITRATGIQGGILRLQYISCLVTSKQLTPSTVLSKLITFAPLQLANYLISKCDSLVFDILINI